ncbi:Ran-binding protein 3, partial [Trachymyrmex cornetzi]
EGIEDIDRPPLVLKVDPPEELLEDSTEDSTINNSTAPTDQDTHVYAESNDQESTSAAIKSLNKKHCSVLAVSKLENSFGINEPLNPVISKSKSSILRPSQLSVITNSSMEKSTEDVKLKFLPLGASTKENENNINNSVASSTSTPSFVFAANCRTMVRPGLSLTQAAQVLEEANRANKRKYNQVTLLTGEEGETNVLQINCKLFAFDKSTSSWQERGRGMLRLNDRDEESRLVGRTAGTQRLILNTKVWPGMTAERAGSKSLRLTAMDVHGDIRIFIVQAAPKEVDQLHSLLLQRLKRAQDRHPKKLATDH